MPVAVAPVDGQVGAVTVELGGEGGDQGPVLAVDGADAAEAVVVLGDLLEPRGGTVAARGARCPGTA